VEANSIRSSIFDAAKMSHLNDNQIAAKMGTRLWWYGQMWATRLARILSDFKFRERKRSRIRNREASF
jgi:hypothetical protein